MIIDETITNKAPNNVLEVGISFQIKYPNIIATTNPRYFKGESKLTSEYLYECDSPKFARPPHIPTIDSKNKSIKLGKIHP